MKFYQQNWLRLERMTLRELIEFSFQNHFLFTFRRFLVFLLSFWVIYFFLFEASLFFFPDAFIPYYIKCHVTFNFQVPCIKNENLLVSKLVSNFVSYYLVVAQ